MSDRWRTTLKSLLLLSVFLGGGLVVSVADALIFHRLSTVVHSQVLPAFSDASDIGSHGSSCTLDQPAPRARQAPAPPMGPLQVPVPTQKPSPAPAVVCLSALVNATLKSRAPPLSTFS